MLKSQNAHVKMIHHIAQRKCILSQDFEIPKILKVASDLVYFRNYDSHKIR